MLNKVIEFSVKNKLIIALFVFAIAIWGGYEVTRLPIDAVPDITDNQVQIITVSPALGAPDVERLITFPLEQACSNIPGLKNLRSFSRFGLSLVTVVFNDETDLYWARQQIAERINSVKQDLPQGVGNPEMAPVTTGLGEIYQYVLRPKKGYEVKYDAMQLRTLQDWIVRRGLLGTPGVAEVASFGGKLKQYEVAINQDRLKAHGLTITDVFDALEKNNQNTGGAYIEKGPSVLYIRSEGLTGSLEDIGQIVVKTTGSGIPILVRDVATIKYGNAVRYGAMTYNDQGEVAGAVVMMLKGENSSAVIKRVKERIEAIQKMLPEGVVIEPFLDRTKMVNNAISTVKNNLIEGALIVIFVLIFFLSNVRAGLIVASVIPLSMLFAIILMNKFGVGGNLMSLGAIDFGLIVDGSVIVIEAILHRFSHSKHFKGIASIDQNKMDYEVSTSTGKMITSAVFSQIIILIVYLPIMSLQGIEGKMFKPMALTIAFAILGAFLLSITYVPMMAALTLSKKLNHKQTITDRFIIWIERKYTPFLRIMMEHPRKVIGGTILLFAASVAILMGLGGEFLPQLEEGDFAVETRLLTGSNLGNTIDYTQKAAKLLLQKFPEVEKVVTKIGSSEIPTDPMPFEAGDMIIVLKDKKEWTSAHTFPDLSQKMTKELSEIPGITVGFQFPVQMRFNELMTGARQDVVCKIFGENLDTLTEYAHRLNDIIKTIDGSMNIYEETVTGMPQVVIKYNREAMATYGLNVTDINKIVNTAFAGQSAGMVYEGEKRFDMVVRLDGESRKNISDIQNLLIHTPTGTQIPLGKVASIEETDGVNQVQRENTKRRIIVGFNIHGRDVQSIVEELQKKVDQKLHLPRAYNIVYGGSFENMTAAKERLTLVVPIALLLIFILLYFAFSSIRQGLLIYSAIPLSAMGGIFALQIRGMPFSISAGVGFIALFGVAVLNGILLVSEFNRLKNDGWTDVKRIVIHATRSKMRAILMTALVPSLGFIPMAVSAGAGGEVQKPLATVVIGGLIISTMLSLFVLPILYIIMERNKKTNLKPIAASIILVLLSVGSLNAQQKISLSDALDTAFKNNVSMKLAKNNSDYWKAMKNTAFDIDKMNLGYEYGQINTYINDNKFTASQSFQFPTVYKRQLNAAKTQIEIADNDFRLRWHDIELNVKRTYFRLLLLRQKKAMLLHADSVFEDFLAKARTRLKLGETDNIEAASAENLRMQVARQLRQVETDESLYINEFKLLLNVNQPILPADDSLNYGNYTSPSDERAPLLLTNYKSRIALTLQNARVESAKLLPTINLGFSSATIIGWQTTTSGADVYYNNGYRFNTYTVGIGVPLFYSGQKARIQAAKINATQAQYEYELAKMQLEANKSNLLTAYAQQLTTVQQYKNTMLPNAQSIISAANQKYYSGDINYLEWVMLMNQAWQTKTEYLDAAQQLNETTFELERISATR